MITVIGIGQTLRGDDAVGVLAVRRWQETCPETSGDARVRIELEELPGLSLLDLISGTPIAILVDAVMGGGTPGRIHLLEISDLESFGPGSDSAHGWGAAETLRLGILLNPASLPEKIILIGIEIASLGLGEQLSLPVEAAIEPVVTLLDEQVRLHLRQSPGEPGRQK